MDIRGYCFWAKDYPNNGTDHYIVVASSENDDNKALVVPFSSIKFNPDSQHEYKSLSCKYYDKACVLDVGDIKDADNNLIVVIKPSYIRYEWAQEIDVGQIFAKQVKQQLHWKCTVDKSVLEKIQNGAKTSDELPEYYQKYFLYF